MSEAAPENAESVTDEIIDTPPDSGTEPEVQEDQPNLAAELERWKAQSRKWENRAKENSKAAGELSEIKKAGMSEAERAKAELAEVTRERDEARTTHSRVMAAAAHDLPVELIDHLGSGTDDEINERAELFSRVIRESATSLANEILASREIPSEPRNGYSAARPVESMRPGSSPSNGDTPTTADQWFRHLIENR